MSEFEKLVTDGKSVKVLPGVHLLTGQKVGIDECTLIFPLVQFGPEFFFPQEMLKEMTQADLYELYTNTVLAAAEIILEPIGLGLSDKIFRNGMNQYKFAQEVGIGAGVICTGGNNNTLMFRITGHGTKTAHHNWCEIIFPIAEKYGAHLTRIDLAFDDYIGELYNVRSIAQLVETGIFQRSNTPPKFEQKGEWLRDDPKKKGLTLYVGDRSSKMARIYEKGKQLGDTESPWVRFEVELHSSLYALPNKMLISPSPYFAAMYPCCEWIQNSSDINRLILKEKTGLNTLDGIGDWLRTQTGHYLQQLRNVFGDAILLDWICRDGKPVNAIQSLELLTSSDLADLIQDIQAKYSKKALS